MPTCKLSIIIVYYKTYELTMECLRSVMSFMPSFVYEIILVDNWSSDEIGEKVSKDFPNVKFIETGKNCGFSKANNLGIVNSRGRYILLLNSDTKIIEPIFDQLIEYMDSHPEIGAIGPRHLDGNGKHQISYGKFPNIHTEILRKIMHYQISLDDRNIREYLKEFCSKERKVDWLSGSCLLLRRDALKQTGLLDESLFMYFEDIDICKRINDKGWQAHYFPSSTIVHYSGQSVKENVLAGLVEYRHSQLYFSRKYYGIKGEILIRIALFLKFGILGLFAFLEYSLRKIFKKNTQDLYIRMLLSKKVLDMVFSANRRQLAESSLST